MSTDTTKKILIVDDEPAMRMMIRAVLEDRGWNVDEAPDGRAALDGLACSQPDVVLCDMKMPGMNGMEVLGEILALYPGLPVVMLTAFGSVGSAVEAMKTGAFDYLAKPVDNDELAAVLAKALEYGRLLNENMRLKEQVADKGPTLVGASPAMLRLRELIQQAGPSEATILVLGESGTGKELVADSIHCASSRAGGPLVKVNCAALPENLLESELFGYAKGAFTGALRDKPGRFQLASGGTLFLDEIGEMPLLLQAKLLRALQEKVVEPLGGVKPVHVDARIVAATNKDLRREVDAGNFREDLYFRLSVLEIPIPPLRERAGDLPLLVSFLLGKLGKKNHKEIRTVAPAFLDALNAYSWPGNVRELENVLERALILARADTLGPELLPPQITGENSAPDTAPAAAAQSPAAPIPDPAPALVNESSLEDAEKAMIIKALDENGGHRERTADALGISRRTLQYKLKKYGLTRRS